MNFFSEHMTEALAAALNRSEQTSLAGGGEGGKRTRPLTSSRPERRGVLRLGHPEGSPFIDRRSGHPKAAHLHLVAWIRQGSRIIRHLWRLTYSEASSL